MSLSLCLSGACGLKFCLKGLWFTLHVHLHEVNAPAGEGNIELDQWNVVRNYAVSRARVLYRWNEVVCRGSGLCEGGRGDSNRPRAEGPEMRVGSDLLNPALCIPTIPE